MSIPYEGVKYEQEVTNEIHSLLGAYMKDKTADQIIAYLAPIIADAKDGPKICLLLKKWCKLHD